MDYMKFVELHRNTDADITIGCLPVDHDRASDFGLMKIDDSGQILVLGSTSFKFPDSDSKTAVFGRAHHGVQCLSFAFIGMKQDLHRATGCAVGFC